MTKTQRIIADTKNNRHRFVCTAQEFVMRYGYLTTQEADAVSQYVVVCKDGMLRPR